MQLKRLKLKEKSGGNLVKVTLNGEYEIKSIVVSDEAKKESMEIINDLIIAAYNNAKEKLKKNLQKNFPKLLVD